MCENFAVSRHGFVAEPPDTSSLNGFGASEWIDCKFSKCIGSKMMPNCCGFIFWWNLRFVFWRLRKSAWWTNRQLITSFNPLLKIIYLLKYYFNLKPLFRTCVIYLYVLSCFFHVLWTTYLPRSNNAINSADNFGKYSILIFFIVCVIFIVFSMKFSHFQSSPNLSTSVNIHSVLFSMVFAIPINKSCLYNSQQRYKKGILSRNFLYLTHRLFGRIKIAHSRN